jgi:hypothetical protein
LEAVSLPKPEPGLVVRYSYLWHSEYREGREEGVKDRPCAIVLAIENQGHGRPRVVVLPVTHTPPKDPALAIEVPAVTKSRLGLDADRSWIVLSESNEFFWPGPDLRRAKGKGDGSVAYGFLPPAFYAEVKRRFVALAEASKSVIVKRTE